MQRRESIFDCTHGKERLTLRRLLEVMLDIELDRPESEMDIDFIEDCLDALLMKNRLEPCRAMGRREAADHPKLRTGR